MEAVERLSSHLEDRPSALRNIKQKGGKIVGYCPNAYAGRTGLCLRHTLALIHGTAGPFSIHAVPDGFLTPLPGADATGHARGFYQLPDLGVVPVTDLNVRVDSWEFFGVEVFRLGSYIKTEHGWQHFRGIESLKERWKD
jgi:hypothetical protein